jgi:hypothetical protein
MAPCSAVALVALIALAGAARADAALFDSPLKTAIDTAVQDAVKSEPRLGEAAPPRPAARAPPKAAERPSSSFERPPRLLSARPDRPADARRAEVLAGFGAVGGEIGDAAAPALPVLGATSAFATQLAGDYAAMGKFAAQSVKSLGGQFGDHLVGLGASLGNVGDTVGAALEAYDARYCEPAVCKPPAKQKAEFTGPGFTLTLSVGNCTFSEAALLSERADSRPPARAHRLCPTCPPLDCTVSTKTKSAPASRRRPAAPPQPSTARSSSASSRTSSTRRRPPSSSPSTSPRPPSPPSRAR